MSTYLWQNFLKDASIIKSIATSIGHLYEKTWAKALVEIGPWKWAITKKIKDISECFFVTFLYHKSLQVTYIYKL